MALPAVRTELTVVGIISRVTASASGGNVALAGRFVGVAIGALGIGMAAVEGESRMKAMIEHGRRPVVARMATTAVAT